MHRLGEHKSRAFSASFVGKIGGTTLRRPARKRMLAMQNSANAPMPLPLFMLMTLTLCTDSLNDVSYFLSTPHRSLFSFKGSFDFLLAFTMSAFEALQIFADRQFYCSLERATFGTKLVAAVRATVDACRDRLSAHLQCILASRGVPGDSRRWTAPPHSSASAFLQWIAALHDELARQVRPLRNSHPIITGLDEIMDVVAFRAVEHEEFPSATSKVISKHSLMCMSTYTVHVHVHDMFYTYHVCSCDESHEVASVKLLTWFGSSDLAIDASTEASKHSTEVGL